jgi:uncharacterized protein YdhG (YjbR/CyaY superfamily)
MEDPPAPPPVAAYLAAIPEPMRAAVEHLRATIRTAAPDADEAIYYRMPAFRSGGRALVSYAAFSDHYSLFPLGSAVLDALGDEVAPYRAGKGTLRFRAGEPLPEDLVRRIVRARIEAVAAGRR